MTASTELHVAGDVLDTDGEQLAATLDGGPWQVRRKADDEIEVRADRASLDFYARQRGSGRGWYLVGGSLELPGDAARALLADVAGRLAAAGLVYHLELAPADGDGDEHVLDHPAW
jgi:hypothetical protein